MSFRGNDPEWHGCMILLASGRWVLPISDLALYLVSPGLNSMLHDKFGTNIEKYNHVFLCLLL